MDEEQLIEWLSPTVARRLRVVENVLVGKRSVSTLYWGMRYQRLDWLGYDRQVTRQKMDQAVASLVDQQLITVTDNQARLTPTGQTTQATLLTTRYQPQAFKIRLTVDVATFWQRLLLVVQVVSEASYQERHYYPLQMPWAVKQFVKRWYQRYRTTNLSTEFQTTLEQFLGTQDDQLAVIFSQSLSGHEQPGTTLAQLTRLTGRTPAELMRIRVDLTCLFVQWLQQPTTNASSAVVALLAGLEQSPVSQSALETLSAFNQGVQLAEISQKRRLKPSTVREHLLEAAIFLPVTAVDYQRALPDALMATMTTRFEGQALDDWQFDQVSDLQLEFWQFRLFEILRSKVANDG